MDVATQDEDLRPRVIGRYAMHRPIARGGMATVHLGRLLGPVGFSRTVAIKRLHPQLANDPEFVTMFLDEARLAARVTHPNVVSTLDVVATKKELFLVMEYVPGESLGRLLRAAYKQKKRMPLGVVSSIMSGVLHGLHAAHEAKTERGEALAIVHRDVSPQNILIGADGIARVLDFGIAKAAGQMHETQLGQVKGKLAYMAPEQLAGCEACRLADIYSAGVVLWELIAGRRLFSGKNPGEVMNQVLSAPILAPSEVNDWFEPRTEDRETLETFDRIVLQATRADATARFATAREMALAIEACVKPAAPSQVAKWLDLVAAQALAQRANLVAEVESASMLAAPPANLLSDDDPDSDRSNEPRMQSMPTESAPIPLGSLDLVPGVDTRTSLMGTTTASTHARSRETRLAVVAGLGLIFGAIGALAFARHDSISPATAHGSIEESRDLVRAASTKEEPAEAFGKEESPAESMRAADSTAQAGAPKAPATVSPSSSAKARGTNRAASTGAPPSSCWRIDSEGMKHLNTRDPRCMQ
jgi:serine/threonine-protein kinase